ncbi:MAG: sensor histidine kinase, partial [Spirochaetota bacterium]
QHILRRLVLGYIALIAVPAVLIGVVVNLWMTATVLGRASQMMTDRVEQWRSAVATGTAQVESIGEVLQYNSAFTRYLTGDLLDRADRVIQYRQEIEPLLAFSRALNPYVQSIRVYPRADEAARLGSEFSAWTDLMRPIRERASDIGYVEEWKVAVPPDADATTLTYYRVIYDDLLSRPVGVAEIDVDPAIMIEPVGSVAEQGTSAIVTLRGATEGAPAVLVARTPGAGFPPVDSDDLVRSAATSFPASASTDSASFAPGKTLLARADLGAPPLRLLLRTPRRVLLRDLLPVRILAAATVPVIVLLLSWVYYSVYYSWSRRIVRLTDHIRASSHDQLEEFEDTPSNDEVSVLVHHYNELVERIRSLLDSLRIAEVRQREAAFRALLSQMNPHFLYNALESIRMMAEAGRCEEAAEMSYLLGTFSRYSLSDTSMISTVSAEIEHARLYLAIHQSRMRARLRYSVDVEPAAERAECPRFTVQPIVENCIKHGIGNRRAGGQISVVARGTDDLLEIWIQDDGHGMDASALAALRSRLVAAVGPASENRYTELGDGGIGLVNVHERVVAFAGPASGITVTSEPQRGTEVTIRIRRTQS